MSRVRIRFSKHGAMKYLGHLDLLRFFQKAIKRAQLPVLMSRGFSPHQLLSFAMPLSVGLTSEGEYFDMELDSEKGPDISCDGIRKRLSSEMVSGIEIISVSGLSKDEKNVMSAVSKAMYIIYYKRHPKWEDKASPDRLVSHFDELSSLTFEKATKKGTKTLDLKKEVTQFKSGFFDERFFEEHPCFDNTGEFLTGEGDPYFTVTLSAGSNNNIRPEAFFEVLLYSLTGEYFTIVTEGNGTGDLAIHRVDLFLE